MEFVGWRRENDKRHGQQHSEQGQVRAGGDGVGGHGNVRRASQASAHLSLRRGIISPHTAGERGRARRCCWALKRPGARKGRHFVQGRARPIVFRVGMFGYVRLSYVRYFCWSLAQPQMPPDSYLPICIGRLLPTPGSRFCVANAGNGLAWGLHSHDSPCAFRYPFIEVRTYGLVRRELARGRGHARRHEPSRGGLSRRRRSG